MSSSDQPSLSAAGRLADKWSRFVTIYEKEIWRSASLNEKSVRGACYAVLRVISITTTVFLESRIASRAAALSFSSLLGIGPLIAIAVLIAGFALGNNRDSKSIADTMTNMIKFVAPQIGTYETLAHHEGEPKVDEIQMAEREKKARAQIEGNPLLMLRHDKNGDGKLDDSEWETARASINVNPDLVNIISNIIEASRSGFGGAVGALTLILIVLLLFKSIEDTFNDIWGVRQGRSVLMRIVLYWTILTLGAVLFFTAVALLAGGTALNMFKEHLPPGFAWLTSLSWSVPVFSFGLLAAMLMLFYRVIPNTRVFWRAAFAGALVVSSLLVLNNFFSFLYLKRVVLEKSLYGGLALPLVMMSALYIFWLCVLTGGIVSYALQNVHFRNSQVAWATLAESMREQLSLVVFLTICRRFRDCLPPISASHLSTMLKVPTQLLNECMNRLVQLKLVTTLRADPGGTATDYLYQPARPLNRMTLYDFKTLDDNFGDNPIGASLERIDPLLLRYNSALSRLGEQEFFQKTLEQLFDDNPFDESRPPFAMGERRPRAQTSHSSAVGPKA